MDHLNLPGSHGDMNFQKQELFSVLRQSDLKAMPAESNKTNLHLKGHGSLDINQSDDIISKNSVYQKIVPCLCGCCGGAVYSILLVFYTVAA